MQAGKDVYVEKPASHNLYESRQLVKAARKYNRMVQVGSQSRSMPKKMKAIQLLRDGVIGTVYHARGECFRRRFSIGHTPDEPVPPGLDWDKFLGPAQMKPYSKNKFAYNWHWFWDTGNGDIGNQGVHEMDIALWGLGKTGWPVSVTSHRRKVRMEGRSGDTEYATRIVRFRRRADDLRRAQSSDAAGRRRADSRPNYVGNIFFGTGGFLVVDHSGFEVYKSTAGNISGEAARGLERRQQREIRESDGGKVDKTSRPKPTCKTSSPRSDRAITRS